MYEGANVSVAIDVNDAVMLRWAVETVEWLGFHVKNRLSGSSVPDFVTGHMNGSGLFIDATQRV